MDNELMDHLELVRFQNARAYASCMNKYEKAFHDGYAFAIADVKDWLLKRQARKVMDLTVGDVKV